uniref:Uncharacterized protein n=1 Tax=Fagus sylvatica TaxID=28930 RepID=A0A2N9EYA2_FAGSY
MFIMSQGVNPLSLSLWAHVLQTRDLVVLQNKSSGFEVYSPHFLTRQFGLLQSVPLPPIFIANVPWHKRSVCTNEEAEVIIVEGISKITAAKVEPFRIVSDALPLFTSWWEALMLSFNNPETLKLIVWEVKQTPTRGKRKIIFSSSESESEEKLNRRPKQKKTEEKEKRVLEEEETQPAQKKISSCAQVFTRRNKGIVIKDPSVVKDLASKLAKANQVIASQRQEITAISIKAHQDAVSIITQEISIHLSYPEKKKKLAAEKERAVKIKQEQALQVQATLEAKKKAIQEEEEKRRVELEKKQKEELDAKKKAEEEELLRMEREKKEKEEEIIKKREEDLASTEPGPLVEHEVITSSISISEVEEVISNQLEVEADLLVVPTVPHVEETKEETTTPDILTPDIEIIEPTPEDVNQITNLVLATLTPISTAMDNEKEIQFIQKGYDEKVTAKSEFQQEFEQTLKKYEDTKQEISKQKDNIIDSSTELSLEEKITSLTTEVEKLRRIPEAVWNNLRNSFNNFQL